MITNLHRFFFLIFTYLVRPVPSYYFPTLHQLKFEVEDGTTPNARPVRFGYNPQEFPDFSWRGYAVMSPAQVSTHSHQYLDTLNTLILLISYSMAGKSLFFGISASSIIL